MERVLIIASILGLNLFAPKLCSDLQATDPPNQIKPVMIWSGRDSAVTKPACERCCTQKELRAVWQKHQGSDDLEVNYHCPEVDFDSFMVVVVFDGTWDIGSTIRLVEILEEADCVRLRFESRERQTGVADADESAADRLRRITRSYAFIVLPASKKAVVIEEDGRRDTTDPYRWNEHKRFAAIDKK